MAYNFTYYAPTKVYFGRKEERTLVDISGNMVLKTSCWSMAETVQSDLGCWISSGSLCVMKTLFFLNSVGLSPIPILIRCTKESGCVDIMMHTMERYFTNGGNMEITDTLTEGLLKTVMKNAVILHTDPQNYNARAEVMWAGSLAHNDLTGCGNDGGDFMSHKLEHEMSGMFDVTHGAGLAAIWPSWARYVKSNCLERFVRYAKNVMGISVKGTDAK